MSVKYSRKEIEMPKMIPVRYPVEQVNCIERACRWACYIRYWRMLEDWYFELDTGDLIMIPQDFEFDGASIPRVFRNIMSPVGPLFLAGIIHDYSYRYDRLIGVLVEEDNYKVLYDYCPGAGKTHWDNLFRSVVTQTSGLKIIGATAWSFLRVFGFIAWKKHRKIHHPSMFLG